MRISDWSSDVCSSDLNFFPKSSSVVLRRGKVRYATLGDETKPTLSLFAYVNGLNKRLFGATDDRVYDIFGWGSDWIEMFGSYTGGYRSEEHTSELQSLMRISYAVFCLKKKINFIIYNNKIS